MLIIVDHKLKNIPKRLTNIYDKHAELDERTVKKIRLISEHRV